ncbi:MFS transporter ACS family solute carrier family 17 member 9 [Fasciola gigantica]|uniref:MFS transporter ACS family solute carrier family 17 member 9 n=1 Tax=Fasciola gigantica TaxID=46835 RepID=A0A504YBD1_FASGI|nr:MFS transporter ACS family solute carrier family 17 member 9 [Fasciola gigantica]
MVCLFLGGVGLYASRAVLPISSVSMAVELHWNRQATGFIMGVFFWGYALTQYLAGYLSDRLGGELVICLSSFIWAVITLTFVYLPYVSNDPTTVYNLFLCARFILGFFQGFYYPSLASLMAKEVHPMERSFTYAVLNAGAHFGTLVCGSVGSYLVTASGWRTPFATVGVMCIIWSVLTYMLMVQPKQRRHKNALNSKSPTTCRTPSIPSAYAVTSEFDDSDINTHEMKTYMFTEPTVVSSTTKSTFSSSGSIEKTSEVDLDHSIRVVKPMDWDKLARHPPFWVMLLANFVHNNSFYIILNWCPSYFHDNFPDARSWVFNMVPWLIIFPSVLLGGFLADNWIRKGVSVTYVRKTITTIVLLGSSLFLLLLTVLEDYYSSLVCMAMALACLGFHCSGVLLNPQDLAPNHGGQLYGVMATVGTIPGFLGVYLAGYLLDVTHRWSVVFFSTSALSLVGWVAYTWHGSGEPIL